MGLKDECKYSLMSVISLSMLLCQEMINSIDGFQLYGFQRARVGVCVQGSSVQNPGKEALHRILSISPQR